MKKKPKFSTLMSVYYKEKSEYLEIALNSIINQSLQPNEIILVEDGPLTDDLYQLIDKYTIKYDFIKVIKLEKNMGLGNALNIGLKECKYELVARMDTDDYSMKNRFERQIECFINNPNYDIVGTNVIEYDEKLNKKISIKKVPENDEEIKKYIKKRNPINHMSVMYKKSKVMEAGNYIDCPYFEDYYLWCRMAKNNCVFYNVQENLVKVRAGLYMIEKRGGIKYLKYIINFQNKIKKIRLINNIDYIFNVFIRSTISLCPKKIRFYIYNKKLRNKEKGATNID